MRIRLFFVGLGLSAIFGGLFAWSWDQPFYAMELMKLTFIPPIIVGLGLMYLSAVSRTPVNDMGEHGDAYAAENQMCCPRCGSSIQPFFMNCPYCATPLKK